MPGRDWDEDLRLGIAGMGLIASPLQSAWVQSQINAHLEAIGWTDDKIQSPEQVLWDQVGMLVASVRQMAGLQTKESEETPKVGPAMTELAPGWRSQVMETKARATRHPS